MTKQFSIVVPVYNGEGHIKKSIDTLLKQDYDNYEIIIINDGSTDGTENILNEFYKSDSRIKIINNMNKGVSFSRNLGIQESSGEYILFLDSDDEFAKDALKLLSEIVNREKPDLLLFGFSVTGDDSRKNDTTTLKSLERSDSDQKRNVLKSMLSTKNNILGYVWRGAYSTDFLKTNNIYFEQTLKISEDFLFLIQCVNLSKNLSILSDELYQYKLGESSMSNKFIPSLLEDMVWVNDWIGSNIVSVYPEFLMGYRYLVANTYIRYVQNTIRNKDKTFVLRYREIQENKIKYQFQPIMNQAICHLKEFDFKSKIAIVLFKFHLDLIYEVLFEIKERRPKI